MPTPYKFPFSVPRDLRSASSQELKRLHSRLRAHAADVAKRPPDPSQIIAMTACRDHAAAVLDALGRRRGRSARALAGHRPRAVPRVRDVARGSHAPLLPIDAGHATMRASAPLAGFPVGHTFVNFSELVAATVQQIERHPAQRNEPTRYAPGKRPVTIYVEGDEGRVHELHDYNRQPVAEIYRNFPDGQRITAGTSEKAAYKVAEHVASEKRLPGGSLVESAKLALRSSKPGKGLTAAAGWCGPSETIYDLVETESEDGVLDAPEMSTPRGGWNIPINGGPEFAAIYGQLGNGGDTHLTEADVIADLPKISLEIPCPPFEEVRLGVDYFSLTGGLLQRRGYPEMVARFSRAALVGLVHKVNRGFIADIVSQSTNAGMVPVDPAGDDAASAVMSAVDLAVMDAQYRNRGGFNSTMEVVLPRWVLVQLRAALTRRRGVARLDLADAEILEWFTIRNAVPRFVVDWQDAFSDLPTTGPGAATPLLRLPTTTQFLVYAAGTWIKATQEVIALDTVMDSTLLTTNQYVAMFAETGWAALRMQPLSRRYTVHVDPSGVVGCCDAPDMALLS